jgi:hypothetical protein
MSVFDTDTERVWGVACHGAWHGASFEWAILHQQRFCGTAVVKALAVALARHGLSRALSQATIDDTWDAMVDDSSWVSPILVTSKGW